MLTGQVRGANPHFGWIAWREKGSTFFAWKVALGITNLDALAGRHLVTVRYALYAFQKAKTA
jgi:hypothetical protein